jgi:hypothetical protein
MMRRNSRARTSQAVLTRTVLTRTALTATALAAAALAVAGLAGCSAAHGSPAGASGPTAESSASPDAEIASIVACYRSHGDPGFPDPVYDPHDGRWHFGASPGGAPLSTQQACRHLFPQAVASPPVSQAQFQQLVKFAECMRAHGLTNWPDPGPDGSFGLPPSFAKKAVEEQAGNACQHLLPSGGLNVHLVP